MTAMIVTANRLLDGEVVYWTAGGDWSEKLSDGAVFDSKEESEAMLERASATGEELKVVGPYLAQVELEDGVVVALGQRETIRAAGPTVHPHFGKQARKG